MAFFSPRLSRSIFFWKYRHVVSDDVLPNGWHENELLLLRKYLKSNSVFFDVGMSVGIYTEIASQLIDEANIHGFEPIPIFNDVLNRIFPKVNVNKIALSNVESVSRFKIPIINGKKYSARASVNVEYKEDGETASEELVVNTTTLDSYCVSTNVERIDLIKIDVEGHEVSVLEGGWSTIKKHMPTLIVEIEQRHHQESVLEIIDRLKALGYRCKYVSATDQKLVDFEGKLEVLQSDQNFGSRSYVNNFIFEAYPIEKL